MQDMSRISADARLRIMITHFRQIESQDFRQTSAHAVDCDLFHNGMACLQQDISSSLDWRACMSLSDHQDHINHAIMEALPNSQKDIPCSDSMKNHLHQTLSPAAAQPAVTDAASGTATWKYIRCIARLASMCTCKLESSWGASQGDICKIVQMLVDQRPQHPLAISPWQGTCRGSPQRWRAAKLPKEDMQKSWPATWQEQLPAATAAVARTAYWMRPTFSVQDNPNQNHPSIISLPTARAPTST